MQLQICFGHIFCKHITHKAWAKCACSLKKQIGPSFVQKYSKPKLISCLVSNNSVKFFIKEQILIHEPEFSRDIYATFIKYFKNWRKKQWKHWWIKIRRLVHYFDLKQTLNNAINKAALNRGPIPDGLKDKT